ncbi:MAG TPA: Wzz/FepE/Etk N-terminal domain-containing protein, partial [Rubrivivax sp.]|nr:Wzz/FepE/Etk N-terminal domain-containing protein [Rubrivivax sp.]
MNAPAMPEPAARPPSPDEAQEQNLRLVEVGIALAENLRLLVAGPLAAGLLALALTYAFKPTYTARTSLLPPQQQNQNAAASALASLGALGNAAGAAATLRTPGDQYLALLQSTTIADRLISEFKLMEVYDEDNLVDTRRKLDRRVDMSVGKKDGLITIEVDDKDPTRAAAMARRYVDELRRLTSRLALTEAQQRRVFFEAQLAEARDRLTQAQLILQGSGFGAGALRAEPRAAAEAYARVKAEVTATEIRLQVLRRSLADHTPEVQQQLSVLAALRSQLARLETVPE